MSKTVETINQSEERLLLELLAKVESTPRKIIKAARNYALTVLMLDAGLRVGELVLLRIEQLYFAGSPVNLLEIENDQAKYGSGRHLPLSSRVKYSIQTMYELVWIAYAETPDLYAFFSVDPEVHMTVRQVQKVIESASLAALGRKIHPHILRHTFATKLMRKCPMRVVQQLLGHKSLSSTQVYTHPNSEDLQKAIDSL